MVLPPLLSGRVGPVAPQHRSTALGPALACGAFALLVRVALLLSPFGAYDGDAAVNALMAQDVLHGRHLWLVWPGQAYAGTIDVYLQAATIHLLGVGQLAVGLPFAVVGAATVAVLSWTAGRGLRAPGAAWAVGLTVSVYPLWLLLWGTAVGGGGYAVSGLLGAAALAVALTRRPAGPGTMAAIGALSGLALWSQPLAASWVAAAWLVALLSAGGRRRAAYGAGVAALAALPGLALWRLGLRDGTDRTLSPLQDTLTLRSVLGPSALEARARALHGLIGDKALGLVGGSAPLVPVVVVQAVVAAVGVAVAAALVLSLLPRALRRHGPLVPALLTALVLSAVLFVLFPPSLATADPAANVGVPRPLGVPRYVYPGMYALSALAGLAVWALLRRPALLVKAAGGLLAVAVLASSVLSARDLLEAGAYTRTRPATGELIGYAGALRADGVRCVVAGYWDVYPLALASDDHLQAESTFVNRLATLCGRGPGVALLFPRVDGVVGPQEAAYAASRPGRRTVDGPGLVAYLL